MQPDDQLTGPAQQGPVQPDQHTKQEQPDKKIYNQIDTIRSSCTGLITLVWLHFIQLCWSGCTYFIWLCWFSSTGLVVLVQFCGFHLSSSVGPVCWFNSSAWSSSIGLILLGQFCWSGFATRPTVHLALWKGNLRVLVSVLFWNLLKNSVKGFSNMNQEIA